MRRKRAVASCFAAEAGSLSERNEGGSSRGGSGLLRRFCGRSRLAQRAQRRRVLLRRKRAVERAQSKRRFVCGRSRLAVCGRSRLAPARQTVRIRSADMHMPPPS
jgi:hypothetical protein